MKRRITGICVGTLVLGGCLIFAMTKADLTEVIVGQLQFEDMPNSFNVLLRGTPLSGSFDVTERDPVGGEPAKVIGLARYGGLVVQVPIPEGSELTTMLSTWMRRNETEFVPRNGVITILGADGTVLSRLRLENAWPSRITQPRVTRVGFRGLVVAECVIQADRVRFIREEG
jgi:hypothetical protein